MNAAVDLTDLPAHELLLRIAVESARANAAEETCALLRDQAELLRSQVRLCGVVLHAIDRAVRRAARIEVENLSPSVLDLLGALDALRSLAVLLPRFPRSL